MNQLEEVERKLKEFSSKIDANKTSANEFLNDHVENAINRETSTLIISLGEAIAANGSSQEMASRLSAAIQAFLQEHGSVLKNFTQNEWRVDKPTGFLQILF